MLHFSLPVKKDADLDNGLRGSEIQLGRSWLPGPYSNVG